MHTAVVYDSQYGNTAQIAEAIAAEMRAAGPVEMINVRTTAQMVPDAVELLIVGGPTQMHQVSAPLRAQLDALTTDSLKDVNVASFDTRVRGPRLLTGAASGGIASALTKRGAKLVRPPESFLVAAKEGPLVDGEIDRARDWARELLAIAATPVSR